MKPCGSKRDALTRVILMTPDTAPTDEHAILSIMVASKDCTYFEAAHELDALIKDGYLETTPGGVDLLSGGQKYPTCLVMLRAGPRFRR
jgi:hypothetical protein